MLLDKLEIEPKYKHIKIRELTDTGGYHRRWIHCNEILADDEHQRVKDIAEEIWTDEVKTTWTTRLAELAAEQKERDERDEKIRSDASL